MEEQEDVKAIDKKIAEGAALTIRQKETLNEIRVRKDLLKC